MIKVIDAGQLANMLRGACANLDINRELVDSLNVFPVPDGDTGTNMSLTITSAINELSAVELSAGAVSKASATGKTNGAGAGKTDASGAEGEARVVLSNKQVCDAFSLGALKGARGNSGVILSQIFKGMARKLSEGEIDTRTFAEAIANGSSTAYDIVSMPKEGTILTVIRLMGVYAKKIAPKTVDFLMFFKKILEKGEEILADTPNLLPVLKKAGVVDAGGKGLLVLFYGMYNRLAGIEMVPLKAEDTAKHVPIQMAFEVDIHDVDQIKYAYCTEYFVLNLKKKTTLADIDKLRDKLCTIGDSVLAVGDLSFVKVHVHTNTPDKALQYALSLGEIDKIKIENMLEQSRALAQARAQKERKALGMVAICAGAGFEKLFKELGVDVVVKGGQTMNPSVTDIVKAVDSVMADTVIVMPNNKNIILAAEQAMALTKANLVVLATQNVPQGITACINFNPEASVEDNVANMQSSADAIRHGQVTCAQRDTEMDGFKLSKGDIIGISAGAVCASGSNLSEVLAETVASLVTDDIFTVNIYYGEGVTKEEAERCVEVVAKKNEGRDVACHYGGQPHYQFFISAE